MPYCGYRELIYQDDGVFLVNRGLGWLSLNLSDAYERTSGKFAVTTWTPGIIWYVGCTFTNNNRCFDSIQVAILGLVFHPWLVYYSDVIISAMTSQIVGVASVCSSACSGAHKKNTSKLRVTEGYLPVTGEFSALRASNAKNVFIWWRNHVRWKNYINITSLFNDMFLNMIFIFANNRLSIFNDYLIHIDGAYTKIYWEKIWKHS